MDGRKRKQFSVEQKVAMFRDLENGKSQGDVCREQGLSRSTLSTMVKNKETILAAFENNVFNNKRLRKAAQPDVEEAVLKWFVLCRSQNVAISRKMLHEKATQFSAELGVDFKCSDGWLYRFKKRHNISAGKAGVEVKDVSSDTAERWLENEWPDIRKGYEPANIFNANEMGLFFRTTLDQASKFKNEKCVGGKLSNERITVLVCVNMTGDDKRKLLVIGDEAQPSCFQNVRSLPVNYVANATAWMTSEIFNNELRSWDTQLTAVNRKVLLLVESCAAHPHIFSLKNIKLAFLPPNTTSVVQPMDHGIVRSLKCHYRKELVLKIVGADRKKVSLLDAARMVNKAWWRVEASTIRNAFRYGGLLQWETNDFEEEDDLSNAEWLKLHQIHDFDSDAFEEYIGVDDLLTTSESLCKDDDNSVWIKEENYYENTESGDDEVLENVVPQISEVQAYLKLVAIFFESREDTTDSDFRNLAHVEKSVENMKLKTLREQKKIV